MKKIASNELKEFLQDWLDWAEGRESERDYSFLAGLCSQSDYWCNNGELCDELRSLFDGGLYPFGSFEYYFRQRNDTQHKDPNRLAWVRAALNDTLDTWELME